MSFSPYLHREYLECLVQQHKSRCSQCGSGPLIWSTNYYDQCLNCGSHVVSESLLSLSSLLTELKVSLQSLLAKLRGMPKTKVDPFFRLTEGLDL
mgnify:CR=1 FL=1